MNLMDVVYALINKSTLTYIITGKKISKEFILKKSKFNSEKFDLWLDVNSQVYPTINQAKIIANIIHVPFAALYMNSEYIPLKSIPSATNFRTFKNPDCMDESALNIAISDILFEHDFLIEARKELGLEIEKFDPIVPDTNSISEWANLIREYFSIEIEKQFKCKSTRQFYLYLRNQIEKKGVFISCFKNIEISIIRGLAFFDSDVPIIGINDNDRPPAKSFSIIHEIVHIYKKESSFCNEMYNSWSDKNEEIFCNAVAGEVLVPKQSLRIIMEKYSDDVISINDIATIAAKFSVSREVIVRRLLDIGCIDDIEYQTYIKEFETELLQSKEESKLKRQNGISKGIPKNVSREAIDRNSSLICTILYKGYCEDIYSKRDIARYLKVQIKHVDKFIGEVSKWDS